MQGDQGRSVSTETVVRSGVMFARISRTLTETASRAYYAGQEVPLVAVNEGAAQLLIQENSKTACKSLTGHH